MSDHPNVQLVRSAFDAMARGDMAASEAVLADDIVWHEIGRAEPRVGKAALASMGDVDYQIDTKVHDILANDDHAIALVEATATRGGRTFSYRTAEIVHIRDGKITERWAFSDDTAAIAAFFA